MTRLTYLHKISVYLHPYDENKLPVNRLSIYVNDLSGFASLNNRFDSLTSGIVGERSTLVSSRDTFIAMRNNEAFYPTWDFRGKGVSTQSTGSQTALVEKGWFENCPQGIMANNTRLRAKENKMLEVETGIWASLGNAGGITISDNHIEAAHLGIVASHPDPNGTVTITGNYVETDTENAVAGILEIFSMSPTLLNTDTVVVKEAGTGIWGYGSRRIFMRDNRVEMDDPAAAVAGIYLTNVTQSLLETNTVLGSGTSGADNIALHITSSSGNVYCCNTLDNTRIGTYVSGGSVATDNFKGTSFSNHDISLLLPENAILGTQTHTQNRWLQDAGPAVYGVSSNFAENLPFFVDVSSSNGDPTYEPEDFSPEDWFQSATDMEGQDPCDEEVCMVNGFAPESDDVKRIAQGDTMLSAVVLWELQRYVFGRLQGATVSNPTILEFLARSDTNSIGAFYAIQEGINAMFAADSLERNQLKDNLTLAEQKLDSLVHIDELMQEADSAGIAALMPVKMQLLGDLSELSSDNKDLSESIWSNVKSEAGKLYTQNDSICATHSFEINEKAVNGLYLNWIDGDTEPLDSTAMGLLQSIAEQCPLTDGNAVYRARAFLSVLTRAYVSYNDSLLCAPVSALSGNNGTYQAPAVKLQKDACVLFPNPAQNEVNIVWSSPLENIGFVLVFDLLGKQLKQEVVGVGTTAQAIRTGDLPEGMYIFRIRAKGRESVHKVVIKR